MPEWYFVFRLQRIRYTKDTHTLTDPQRASFMATEDNQTTNTVRPQQTHGARATRCVDKTGKTCGSEQRSSQLQGAQLALFCSPTGISGAMLFAAKATTAYSTPNANSQMQQTQVTPLLFSSTPNPTYTLPRSSAVALAALLATAPAPVPSCRVVGFRGWLVDGQVLRGHPAVDALLLDATRPFLSADASHIADEARRLLDATTRAAPPRATRRTPPPFWAARWWRTSRRRRIATTCPSSGPTTRPRCTTTRRTTATAAS